MSMFNGGCKSGFGFPLPLKSHCQQHKDLLISFTHGTYCMSDSVFPFAKNSFPPQPYQSMELCCS